MNLHEKSAAPHFGLQHLRCFLRIPPGAQAWESSAEEEGFEPPVPRGTTVFKTAAFDRSAIPPAQRYYFGSDWPNAARKDPLRAMHRPPARYSASGIRFSMACSAFFRSVQATSSQGRRLTPW